MDVHFARDGQQQWDKSLHASQNLDFKLACIISLWNMKVFGIFKARVTAIVFVDFEFVTNITKYPYDVQISQIEHLEYFLG